MNTPKDSNPSKNPATSLQNAKGTRIVSRNTASTPSRRPVVVRRSSKSHSPVQTKQSTHSHSQKRPVTTAQHPKVIKGTPQKAPSRSQLGEPDFKRSIISKEAAAFSHRTNSSSIKQRVFFDAAIAVVTLSFMVLIFLHL